MCAGILLCAGSFSKVNNSCAENGGSAPLLVGPFRFGRAAFFMVFLLQGATSMQFIALWARKGWQQYHLCA
jgi:hypothetical protein